MRSGINKQFLQQNHEIDQNDSAQILTFLSLTSYVEITIDRPTGTLE
jgi:hypothetical protein